MKIYFVIVMLLMSVSSHAQESESYTEETTRGEISSPPIYNSTTRPSRIRFRGIFDSFRNQSFKSSALEYGAELGYDSVGEYSIYAGASMLYGQAQYKNVSEFGNPYIGAKIMTLEAGAFQNWFSLENSFSQPSGEIAARHNTLTPGLEIRYDRFKTISSLGANYHWRYGEADSKVDVKDIVSAHFSLGRKLGRRVTLEGQVLWYRAFGVKNESLLLARESDWAGAGPIGSIRFESGVVLRTSLLFPIHRTQSQTETEVAVWDNSFPNVSEVTWKTDVGVQF